MNNDRPKPITGGKVITGGVAPAPEIAKTIVKPVGQATQAAQAAPTKLSQDSTNDFEKVYVKNAIEVSAVQFNNANKDRVFHWCTQIQGNVYATRGADGKPALGIPTAEGDMLCQLGDYVIKEPFPAAGRRLYPCKQEVFEKTYSSKNHVQKTQATQNKAWLTLAEMEQAAGGLYRLVDGREFWVDTVAAKEITKRIAEASKLKAANQQVADNNNDAEKPTGTCKILNDVQAELSRARKLFPKPDLLTTALSEEAGELVKAILDNYQGKPANVYGEAIQAIAMAIRLLEEGDPVHSLQSLVTRNQGDKL